jgi:hypothetical protein
MTNVVIFATRYDESTGVTFGWAEDLHRELLRQGHTCVILDASAICVKGSLFQDAVRMADCAVFYGHGEADKWVALPGSRRTGPVPLIDASQARDLDCDLIYAGCCDSIVGLGSSYRNYNSGGSYIGYDGPFELSATNERHFREVANQAASAFINGQPARAVEQALKLGWENLRDNLLNGWLQFSRDAPMASWNADNNASHVQQLS